MNPNCPVQVDDTTHDQSLAEIQKLAHDRIVKEKESRSLKHDRPFTPFAIGDRVLLKAKHGSIKFIGPYEIIEVLSDGYAYQLKSLSDGSECRRRVELLKLFVDREPTEDIVVESSDPLPTVEEVVPSVTPFGFEDIEMAPNGGRMWPKTVPVPSNVPTKPSVSPSVPKHVDEIHAPNSEALPEDLQYPEDEIEVVQEEAEVVPKESKDIHEEPEVIQEEPEVIQEEPEVRHEESEVEEEPSPIENELTPAYRYEETSSSSSDLELVAVDPDADSEKRRVFEDLQSKVKVEPEDQTMASVQSEMPLDQTMVTVCPVIQSDQTVSDVQPVPISGHKRRRNEDSVHEALQPPKMSTRRRPTHVTIHDDSTLTTFVGVPEQPLSKEAVIEFIRTQEDYETEDSLPMPRVRGSREYSIDDQNFFQLAKLGNKWGMSMTHSDLNSIDSLRNRLNSFVKSSIRITMTERNGKKFYIFR